MTPARHRGHDGHGHHGGVKRGRYGNPADLDRMIERQLAPGRSAWQKPEQVIRAIGVRRGQVVADVGAGPGFFTLRLARAVGPAGRVYAVDPEPALLDALRERLARSGTRNVTPVLSLGEDPMLPPGRCDVALIVNTYHHFSDGPAFLRRVARALARGGRVVNIDFAKRETPVGPPVDHRVAREEFLLDARRAGLALVAEHRFLPHQYFLVLRPRRRR
ncbi:MAG: methyltransferase domain-containing protein [candidate division NC10 bacterium]